jgi:hypothetical protein
MCPWLSTGVVIQVFAYVNDVTHVPSLVCAIFTYAAIVLTQDGVVKLLFYLTALESEMSELFLKVGVDLLYFRIKFVAE